MASPPGQPPDGPSDTLLDEMKALRAQVAALTARVYHLEQKSGALPEAPKQVIPPVQVQPQGPPSAGTVPQTPSIHAISGTPVPGPLPHLPASSRAGSTRVDADLEKKIGQYWLNRIGIVAILIGVSYFLKYAFENNWIGPGARGLIGLLTAIFIIVLSGRLLARRDSAPSYLLQTVC